MFSSLPHYPRYTLHLESTDPVPAFIDRRWRGYAEQRRQTLQQLTGYIFKGFHGLGPLFASIVDNPESIISFVFAKLFLNIII